MTDIKIKDEHIKLGQLLKLAGLVGSGLEAKIEINEGNVILNGNVETQRGKKLYDGDKFEYDGKEFVIKAVN